MMTSLQDAWEWYESVQELTRAMQVLGKKYWEELPWEGALGRDNRLGRASASQVVHRSAVVLGDLKDLCVLLLFSVFEAAVRVRVLREVREELPLLRHSALRHAGENALEDIEHGSFFKVLEPFKGIDADLVEQVNQVRRYRNWVAHGRQGEPQAAVEPRTAYDRLQRFLDRLDESATPPG